MNNIVKSKWYEDLVEDCKDIITEAIFTSRWALVEGYHQLGERIVTENNLDRKEIYGKNILSRVAKSIGMSERTLYRAIQFYEKYPELDTVPEGKNISWHKLITKYLPESKNKIILPLPEGKYSVFLVDPPWPYNERQDLKNLYGNTKYHYPSLSIEEIKKLPINNLKTENSVLFLWVATHFLEESLEIIKEWGMQYKSQMIWIKNKGQGGIGWYCWGDHEILLIATSGSFLPKKLFSSVYQSPREEHSKKPDYYYEMIEAMYPEQRYLELFARNENKRKDWTYWGNETSNAD